MYQNPDPDRYLTTGILIFLEEKYEHVWKSTASCYAMTFHFDKLNIN
jgi:hypothetical protein